MRIEPGSSVIVNLANPREKFWGILDEISSAGITVRGIDLNSFDELLRLIAKKEEGIFASTVFFPLARIERMTLDEQTGSMPSLEQQFVLRTGVKLETFLSRG